MKMNIDLKCGNSIELMQEYDDNEFDLCLTDPPYNLGVDYGPNVNDRMTPEEHKQWSIKWFTEARRISKALIFTPGMSNLKMWLTEIEYPKDILCWYVKNSQSHNPISGGFLHWEPILLYGKMAMSKNAFHHNIGTQKYKGSHNCPKPRDLYIDILRTCYKPKVRSVIEPFLGSGTTAMACKVLDIDCVGIDIEPKFVEEAKRNIRQSMYGTVNDWIPRRNLTTKSK